MDRSAKRKTMFLLDFICPGIGHIAVRRYITGAAGLIVFTGAVIALCFFTIVPLMDLIDALLKDAGEIPEQPFRPVPILISLGICILDWIVLILDGSLRPLK